MSNGEGLRVTLASIGDAVIATDAEGRVVFLNPVAQSLTGWSDEEAHGQPLARVFRIVNEHTRQEVENPVTRALREGTVVGLANHTILIARDGTERPIDDSAAPIVDDAGQVGGVVLVFRDITERRQAERSVQDALSYSEAIVATVREPLVVLDGDLRVRTANRSFYRTFGVRPEDTQGQLLYDLGSRQWDIPALRTLLEDILPQNTAFNDFEVRHDFPAIGRKVMLLNARKLFREGNPTELILLAIEDVTALREAEEKRREAETRFTEMVKNVRDHSIFLTDPEGVITSWNVAAERIIGYAEAEAVGKHFSLIFTPEDVAAGTPRQELQQAREEGRAEDERWHVKKGGEQFWALGIVTPLSDAAGRLTGFSKILRDITERKRAHDLLRQQSEALKEADRRKDEFLAMLSHELRNPLAPIRNATQVIRLLGASDPNVRRSTEMVERHVQHMTRLVDDLLDVSRITSGKIKLQVEPVELAAVVARAVETTRPLIDARKHQLRVSLPPEALRLEADPVRLGQVMANLLTNAAKYTEEGGRIGLTVEREGGAAVIRVRDNGVGIPRDKLASVFDVFTQVDRSLERSQGGLGVGLTLVKSLVEMHGGSVEAHSEGAGQGSEFIVRLPVLQTEQPSEASKVEQTVRRPAAPRRVLVVDDNVDAAESLAMLLRIDGHEVRPVYDGTAALEAARTFRPEVILLDIGLPGISGYEVARRLRREPGLEKAFLVALTGYGQDDDRIQSQEAGFDTHLVKPADPTALQELLATSETPGRKGARP
jgi:PAS domain S-box-containing protein